MPHSFLRRFLGALCLLPCLCFAGPININTATADQLSASLIGVGAHKAAAIVAYREKNGPFRSPQDLTKVKGIGDSLVQKNKGLIRVEADKPAEKN